MESEYHQQKEKVNLDARNYVSTTFSGFTEKQIDLGVAFQERIHLEQMVWEIVDNSFLKNHQQKKVEKLRRMGGFKVPTKKTNQTKNDEFGESKKDK